MRFLATIFVSVFLAVPAWSVELFRYRGAAKDGGTLEYVFEAGEQMFGLSRTQYAPNELLYAHLRPEDAHHLRKG
jgi:hypothetical protein